MSSIFLSYAGLDCEIAAQVALGLKGAGVHVWWDWEGIGWGDNWIHKLEDALTQCGGYVILVGSSGVRRWVKFELSLAIKRHIEQDLPIFPLLLPGVTQDSLPPFLATFQAEALPEHLSDIDYGRLAQRLSRGGAISQKLPRLWFPTTCARFQGLKRLGRTKHNFSSVAGRIHWMRLVVWAWDWMACIADGCRWKGRAAWESPRSSERASFPRLKKDGRAPLKRAHGAVGASLSRCGRWPTQSSIWLRR